MNGVASNSSEIIAEIIGDRPQLGDASNRGLSPIISDLPVGAGDTLLKAKAILLFGHGAKNPEWAAPFVAIRASILARDPGALVESGFLELMRPTFAEAVDSLVGQGAEEITVVPIFMAAGSHINKDLPLLAAASMDKHDGLTITLAPPVGAATSVLNAMAEYAMTAYAKD